MEHAQGAASSGDAARDDAPVAGPSTERLDALEAQVRDLESQLASSTSSSASPALGAAALPERMLDRVDTLADRIDTLSETARAAASGLVARERELATIREDLATAKATVDAATAEFRRRVDPAPVDRIQRSIAGLADRLAGFEERQRELAGRLEALADAAAADRSTITSHERALGELSGGIDATSARMDSVVATVRQAVESLLAQVGPSDGAAELEQRVEARLDELARRVDVLDARPRLVRWATPAALADDLDGRDGDHERRPDGDPDAPSFEVADLDSGDAQTDTRGSIVSFGGGT